MNNNKPKKIQLKDWLKDVYYDDFGQYLWSKQDADGGSQMIGAIRGWGAIQNIFKNEDKTHQEYIKEASDFQDKVGKFIADAINEKIKRDYEQ